MARLAAPNLAALLLGVILCEVLLSAAALVSPAVAYRLSPHDKTVLLRGAQAILPRQVVPDLALGSRFSPYAPGHDEWGYRNARVPDRSDILALGDSTTYGVAAGPEEAWPGALGRLSGLRVYNAGISGYGPVEYQIVLEETLRLRPKLVVVGFFLGNDVMDASRSTYVREQGPTRFRNQDPAQLAAIEAKLAVLRAKAARLHKEDMAGESHPDHRSSLRKWLSAHSRTYGLLRETRHELSALWRVVQGQPAPIAPDESFEESARHPHRTAWDRDARLRTVFLNPAYVLLAVDGNGVLVQEGTRITQQIFLEMQARLAAERIALVIAQIPSKHMVYARLIEALGPPIPGMDRYLQAEARLKADMTVFFQANAIRHVDVLEDLRRELANGRALYHEGVEPHPNAAGYEAIAKALLPALREMLERKVPRTDQSSSKAAS